MIFVSPVQPVDQYFVGLFTDTGMMVFSFVPVLVDEALLASSTNLLCQLQNQLTKLTTCFWDTCLNGPYKIAVMKIVVVFCF